MFPAVVAILDLSSTQTYLDQQQRSISVIGVVVCKKKKKKEKKVEMSEDKDDRRKVITIPNTYF
jgi:hypothetical protein